MKGVSRSSPAILTAFLAIGLALSPVPSRAQTYIATGTGTNHCHLILSFSAGEKVVFQHRWNGASLNAKTLLESVITATGGELIVSDGYLTPFAFAIEELTNPTTTGLVVQYQGSYSAPYLNGIRWNGPDGPVGADYQSPDNWWHLWVQGPAHVDQSYAWPEPLPPVELAPNSAWFFGEFSGLADLTLSNGASLGLVYGSADEPSADSSPSLPAPVIQTVFSSSENILTIEFSAVPGARYQLETRTDLSAGSWSPAGEPITATAPVTIVTATMNSSSGRAFYRIALLP